MKINRAHFHTKDNGRHLSPCLRKRCDGLLDPSPSSPVIEITKHQIEDLHDPLAKRSHVMNRSCYTNTSVVVGNPSKRKNSHLSGDGDVWVEVLCKHTKTGEIKSYFKSTKDPGRRVPDEPPTGASRVIFLRPSYIEKYSK